MTTSRKDCIHNTDSSGAGDIVNSQFGWHLQNNNIDLFVTERGGQMAPVFFFNNTDVPVQPYYISPWQGEELTIEEPCLIPLRGDFFCMPFGANLEEYEDEQHPVHGESAGSTWEMREVTRDNKRTTMILDLETHIRAGKITKELSIMDGHNVIYTRHILSGYSGLMPLGHHAIIEIPEEDGGMLLSLGDCDFIMTHPAMFSNPVNGEYQQLDFGKEAEDISRMPLLWQNPRSGDYSIYPSSVGYDDLFCVLKRECGTPSWVAAVYPRHGYLWFALKDPVLLPATCVWISNCGRHASPWNGRNRCLGIEDVCGYFASGLKQSIAENTFTDEGFTTAVRLDPDTPLEVSYIQGVARIPAGFGKVVHAEFGHEKITFIDQNGLQATADVDYNFLLP